jgi:hypothetical protein
LEDVFFQGVDHGEVSAVAAFRDLLPEIESNSVDSKVSLQGAELQMVVPNNFNAVGRGNIVCVENRTMVLVTVRGELP